MNSLSYCVHLRNEGLFSGFMGNVRFSDDLFVFCSDSFHINPEKKTLIPYIYNASIKDSF